MMGLEFYHRKRSRPMDIYTYLKRDHRKVDDLIHQVSHEEDSQKRAMLYQTIRDELLIHADTEEKTFYQAIKEKGGKQLQEKKEHAEEEHSEIRHLIKKLDGTKCEDETWLLIFGELKHAVEHHVKEEEERIFEKAQKILSDAQAKLLAEDMDKLKQQQKNKKKVA